MQASRRLTSTPVRPSRRTSRPRTPPQTTPPRPSRRLRTATRRLRTRCAPFVLCISGLCQDSIVWFPHIGVSLVPILASALVAQGETARTATSGELSEGSGCGVNVPAGPCRRRACRTGCAHRCSASRRRLRRRRPARGVSLWKPSGALSLSPSRCATTSPPPFLDAH